jgi:hypothetical protein
MLAKPFAALAAAYLAVTGNARALVWLAAAAAAIMVAPVAWFGAAGWLEETRGYAETIVATGGRYRTMATNQSAVAALSRLDREHVANEVAGIDAPFVAGMTLELALLGAVLWWAARSRRLADEWGERLALAALFCVMPSFAPISWKSYFVTLLVPYMALVAALWTDRPRDAPAPRAAIVLVALSFALLLAPTKGLSRLALAYSNHLVSSLLVLAALVVTWLDLSRREAHAQDASLPAGAANR